MVSPNRRRAAGPGRPTHLGRHSRRRKRISFLLADDLYGRWRTTASAPTRPSRRSSSPRSGRSPRGTRSSR